MNTFYLSTEEENQLSQIYHLGKEGPFTRWAEVLLLYSEGFPTKIVAEKVGLSRSHTRSIKQKYQQSGMDIFKLQISPEDAEPPVDSNLSIESQELQQEILEEKPQVSDPKEPMSAELTQDLGVLAKSGDTDRGIYVTQVAQTLFDETQEIHQLSPRNREVLLAAAKLHRIKRKPKNSKAEILKQPIEGFSPQEQKQIAFLVQHQQPRKNTNLVPEEDTELENQRTNLLLLALLQIATAVDSSLDQSTEISRLSLSPTDLEIRLSGEQALTAATAAQSASSLWGQLTGQVVHVYADAKLDADQIRDTAGSLTGPGLHPDDTMAEAGRKLLRYHFLQMLLHEPGTREGEDIEELHDMRVATRRMRTAFDVYGGYFEPKAIRALRKGLKATGRSLGAVRDLDVFMEKAEHYLDEIDSSLHSGLDPLMELWSQERLSARVRMLEYLDSDRYQNFVYEMNQFVNTPGLGSIPSDSQYPQPYRVREISPVLVYQRLAAVRAYDQILSNASYEQLHELRIAFKYLRYTMEFFKEVLGAEAKWVIEKIKTVQDHLGDLNDADVAIEILQNFLNDWDQKQRELPIENRSNPEPIVQYLAYRTNERHRLLVTFPEVWQDFNHPEFMRQLALAVSVL